MLACVCVCPCARALVLAGSLRNENCSLCLKPLSVPLWSDGLLIPDDKLLQGLNKNCSELYPVPHSSTYCTLPTMPCHVPTGTVKHHTAFQHLMKHSCHKYSNQSSMLHSTVRLVVYLDKVNQDSVVFTEENYYYCSNKSLEL